MFISEFQIPFQLLEKAMNLPEGVKIVGAQPFLFPYKGVHLTFASDTPAPEDPAVDDISKIGETFEHPENYKFDPNRYKGSTLGGTNPENN